MTIREIDQRLEELRVLYRKVTLDRQKIIRMQAKLLQHAREQLVRRTEDIDKEEAKGVKENDENL